MAPDQIRQPFYPQLPPSVPDECVQNGSPGGQGVGDGVEEVGVLGQGDQ